MDDYIAKPLRREKLLAMVDKWVHRHEHQENAEMPSAVPGTEKKDPGRQCINYNRVIDDFQGDEVYLQKIMEQFLARIPGQLDSIQSAIRKRDDQSVAAAAHAIKGSAATLAMERLRDAACRLESGARDGRLDHSENLLKEIREEYSRIVDHMQAKKQ
jgi:HPt (histidine-containing phosphotransfer) domain-containing protein